MPQRLIKLVNYILALIINYTEQFFWELKIIDKQLACLFGQLFEILLSVGYQNRCGVEKISQCRFVWQLCGYLFKQASNEMDIFGEYKCSLRAEKNTCMKFIVFQMKMYFSHALCIIIALVIRHWVIADGDDRAL